MTNSADTDHLASDLDLHCLLRQGMSCSARKGLTLPFSANYALMTNAFDHQPVDQCTFCNSTEIIYNGNRSSVIIDHIFYKGYKLWVSFL